MYCRFIELKTWSDKNTHVIETLSLRPLPESCGLYREVESCGYNSIVTVSRDPMSFIRKLLKLNYVNLYGPMWTLWHNSYRLIPNNI